MDELKQSVQLAFTNKRSITNKLEAFNLFRAMIDNVNKEVISFLFKGDLPAQENQQIQEAKEVRQDYQLSKDEIVSSEAANREAGQTQQKQVEPLCDMQKSIATMLRFKMWPTDKHKK
jgi:preprotein translocase subunit SecA